MYLSAKRFFSGYEFVEQEKREMYNRITEMVGVKGTTEAPSAEVSVNIGYWRKANAIHGWFVRELAGGRDECQSIYVPREKLEELRALCVSTLADQPAVVMPAQGGTYVQNAEVNKPFAEGLMDILKTEAMKAQFNDPNDTDPLRPVRGSFFGSDVKDEWYYQDLKDTVEIIDGALALDKSWSFEYQASW